MNVRNVIKTIQGQHSIDGAGVHLIRVLGPRDVRDIDPFLMLDAFDSKNPENYIKGFPMHPHRGIETITYLIEGEVTHKDSLGNGGTIHGGESQWMTAGRGILHEEMPQPVDKFYGLQIWLNLPQKEKMVEPNYFDITKDMIKKVNLPNDDGIVRVISGKYDSQEGAHSNHVQVSIFDISLNPRTEFELPIDPENNLFIYIFEGEGFFDDKEEALVGEKTVAVFDEGDTFKVTSGVEGIRFMLFAGKPLNEPIAWGGPIVMNTDDELEEAFNELQQGTFIK